MKQLSVVLIVIAVVSDVQFVLCEQYKSYKFHKLVEVEGNPGNIRSLVKAVKLLDNSIPIDEYAGKIALVIPPRLYRVFEASVRKNEVKSKLVADDFSKLIAMEKTSHKLSRKTGFSWTAYYDVDDIYSWLRNMSCTHPEAELIVGGKSYEGQQLLGLRINTDKKANKSAIFIESGIHAREWIAPATTTYFINQLLTSNNTDIVALKHQFDWHVFPTVNPDGYHYSFTKDRMWRKTRSKSPNGCYGADPNRNWDYNWLKHGATSNPCDYDTYGGSKAFSEIETKTLSEYISKVKNLLGYISFHSTAQMLLIPFSDSTDHVDNYDELVRVGNVTLEYAEKVNGVKYEGPATAAEILYKASGGSMDWVRYALKTRLVYAYELRGSSFQWPPDLIYQQGDEVTQMMVGLGTAVK